MIKDERSYHLRLQEFCDCFMETDYKKELEAASKGVSGIPGGDPEELALKFLGTAILYGATEEIRSFSLKKGKDGKVAFSVVGKGTYQLPPPAAALADQIFSVARSMVHLDQDEGKIPFSLGLRNDRMELNLEFERKGGNEAFSVTFPQS